MRLLFHRFLEKVGRGGGGLFKIGRPGQGGGESLGVDGLEGGGS